MTNIEILEREVKIQEPYKKREHWLKKNSEMTERRYEEQ